jgi:NCS1 family nucleobase:cation symporter-1
VNIRDLYGREPAWPHRSIGGFNPAAVLALAAGCAVYLELLNPLSYASSGSYRVLTASLPAAVSAAAGYILFSRLLGHRSQLH